MKLISRKGLRKDSIIEYNIFNSAKYFSEENRHQNYFAFPTVINYFKQLSKDLTEESIKPLVASDESYNL